MGAIASAKLSGSRTGLPDNGGRVHPREVTCGAAPQRERHQTAQGVAAIHVMAEPSHARHRDARADGIDSSSVHGGSHRGQSDGHASVQSSLPDSGRRWTGVSSGDGVVVPIPRQVMFGSCGRSTFALGGAVRVSMSRDRLCASATDRPSVAGEAVLCGLAGVGLASVARLVAPETGPGDVPPTGTVGGTADEGAALTGT